MEQFNKRGIFNNMNELDIKKYFGSQHLAEVTSILNSNTVNNVKLKNPKTTLILAIFLGMFGIDRLYQGGVKVF